MRTRIVVICAVLLLVGSLVLASGEREAPLSEEPATTSVEQISITAEVLKGPTGMGMIRLIDEEPAFGEGVEIDYAINGSPQVLVSKVLSGEVDIAALPSNVAAKLYNGGVPYKFAAINTLGVLYVVSNGPEIDSFDDFVGRRVDNSARGANPDVIFRYLLSEHDVDPEQDVELRYFNHTELAQLVISGRSELAVLPEPFVTRVTNASESARVEMDLQEAWRDLKGEEAFIGMGCLVVKDALAKEHPELLRAFLDEYRDSIEWVNANPEAAGALIEKHELGFTAASAAAAIPRANIRYIEAQEARTAVEEFWSVLLDYDPASVGGGLPDGEFYLDL